MKNILIVDYGIGNLRSVYKAVEYAKVKVNISNEPAEIINADGIILPGVGAFVDSMKNIAGFKKQIYEYVNAGKPILGICLGEQLLMEESEEGKLTSGLKLIQGKVIRFPHSKLKVPHVGWNSIHIKQNHPLFDGISDGAYVYFVHSYYVDTTEKNTLASCEYGNYFAAAIVNDKGNVFGTQFHPEKSGDIGLKILSNFVNMC